MGVYRGSFLFVGNEENEEEMKHYLAQAIADQFSLSQVFDVAIEENEEGTPQKRCVSGAKEDEKDVGKTSEHTLDDPVPRMNPIEVSTELKPITDLSARPEADLAPAFYSIRKAYRKFNGARFTINRQLSSASRSMDNMYQVQLENGLRITAFEDELTGFVQMHEQDSITLPVSWEVCGEVKVSKTSIDEALDFFEENMDYIKLPRDEVYVEGSFELSHDDPLAIASYNHPFRNPEREEKAPAWPVLAKYATEIELKMYSDAEKSVAEQVCWDIINDKNGVGSRTALHDCARLWMRKKIDGKVFWLMVRQSL